MASLVNNNGSYALIFTRNGRQKKISLNLRFAPEFKKAADILRKKYESDFALGLWNPFESKSSTVTPVKIIDAEKEFLSIAKIGTGTKKTYRAIIRRFRTASGIVYTDRITTLSIQSWIDDQDITPTTKQTYLRHISGFLTWCKSHGYVADNAATHVELQRFENPVHDYMTLEEVKHLVSIAKKYVQDNAHLYHEVNGGHWIYQIIWFAFLSGCRRSECINLKWSDIGPDGSYLIIRNTKGKRARFLPIHTEMRKLIDSLPRVGEFMFTASGVRLIDDKVYKAFKQFVRISGLNPELRFHDLRHSYGYHATSRGANLRFIQDTLGHTDIKTTIRYTQTALKDNEKVLNSLFS